jgi:single-stranded-DNA-specific exonuclease
MSLIEMLLQKRGLVGEEEREKFLRPDFERDTHSPFLLNDMEKAADRLLRAIKTGERIAVYADFDCDGIPGAVILSDFFTKIGYSNFEVYLPHRDREGYGFHARAIDSLQERGVSLIITVDVGGSAHESIRYAKERDIEVIVTDHHEIMEGLPEAYAIVNPKISSPTGGYPCRELCGAAVAWKLVCATLTEGRKREEESFMRVPTGWEKWLLDMVALATVADLVPLVGENRVLAKFGLITMRAMRRVGLRALARGARMNLAEVTEDDIAFSLAPRLNAASRMGEPEAAFQLLATRDEGEATMLARHLESLNTARKSSVARMVKEAQVRAQTRYEKSARIVFLGDPSWKPSLAGLAAQALLEKRRAGGGGGIVCVWGRDMNGSIRGSCRSDGTLLLTDFFSHMREHFLECGGHEKSGGFSIDHEKVHTAPTLFAEAAVTLESRASEGVSHGEHDGEIMLGQATETMIQVLASLAPFGIGNPKPRFLVSPLSVESVRQFGKEEAHIETVLTCTESGVRLRAYDFFRMAKDFSHEPKSGDLVRILATVERDRFRGGVTLRLLDVLSAV